MFREYRLGLTLSKYVYVLGKSGTRVSQMLGAFVLISAMDAIGLGLIGPFIAAVLGKMNPLHAPVLGQVLSFLGAHNPTNAIVLFGVILILFYLVKEIGAYAVHRGIYKFGFQFRESLLERLVSSYLAMPYEFYLARNSAQLVQSILNNTKSVSDDFLIPSLRLVSESLVVLAITIALCFVSFRSLLAAVAVVGGSVWLYAAFVQPKIKSDGKSVMHANEKMIRSVNQSIFGVKEIRVFGVTGAFRAQIMESARALTTSVTRYYSLLVLSRYSMEAVVVIFVIGLSLVGVMFGGGPQVIPIMAVFAAASLRLLPSVTQISASLAGMYYSVHALNAVYDDLRQLELSGADLSGHREDTGDAHERHAFSSLRFDRVTFSYGASDRAALEDISLQLRRGESIGLIGASGAGKTTLVDLLLGFHRPQSGRIIVDGKDIDDYGWRSWRDQIAYLPQNTILLDDTIAANIAFGLPGEHVDRERLTAAAEAAQLSALLSRLPDGLDTVIGEFGARLSGGERQRVALARGFYFNRDIFIMDEATSSLDSETEAQVIDVIGRLHGKKTLVVIAHRLNTVRHCDTIYRLDAGRIVESGSFQQVVGGQDQRGLVRADAGARQLGKA